MGFTPFVGVAKPPDPRQDAQDEYVRAIALLSMGMKDPLVIRDAKVANTPSNERVFQETSVRPLLDANGRSERDPLFRLPHLKCSCTECAKWRAANWHRLSQEYKG